MTGSDRIPASTRDSNASCRRQGTSRTSWRAKVSAISVTLSIAISVVAVVAALVAPQVVHAAVGTAVTETVGTAEIDLVSQPFAITAANSGSIVIAPVSGATSNDSVVVTAHRRIASRASLKSVADGDVQLESISDSVKFRYGSLRGRGGGLVIPVTYGLTTTRTSAFDLGRPGLYPVSIEVRRDARVVASVSTFLFRPDDLPRVRATVIVGQVPTPSHRPDGTVTIAPDTRSAAEALIAVLDAAAGTVSPDLSPELLSALVASPDPIDQLLLQRLRQVVAGATLPTTTYAPVDPSRLVHEELPNEVNRQFELGERATIAALPSARVQRGVYVSRQNLDGGGLASLIDNGVETVILAGEDKRATEGLVLPIEAGSTSGRRSARAITALHGVGQRFHLRQRPVVEGIRIAAEFVMARSDLLEAGNPAENIHLVVDAVAAEPIEVLTALTAIDAIRRSTVLSTVGEVTVNSTAMSVDTEASVDLDRVEIDYEDRNLGAVMNTLGSRRDALASMLATGDPRLTRWDARIGIIPGIDDVDLLNTYVAALQEDMNSLVQGVSVSVSSTLTLGNRTGNIPVRLRNDIDTPLTVRVRVASAKLQLAGGPRVFTVPAGSTIDASIAVRARSNGSFPVRVTLLTPSGEVVVEPTTTITARVNALAGLGQLVSVSIGLVLLTWWFAHWRRSRRRSILPGDGT